MNEAKTAKIRAALTQLDPAQDNHWTDDGLPRESVVRKAANDQTLTRTEIQEAYPGFQRANMTPQPKAAPDAPQAEDPLTGEPVVSHADPAKNTGEFMSEAEVKAELERRVYAAEREIIDAQQAVRDANNRVTKAQNALVTAKAEYTRSYPPMTAAQNIKEFIASEQAQRAAARGGASSQLDTCMQHTTARGRGNGDGNTRGWRRPSRVGQTQTGAAHVA